MAQPLFRIASALDSAQIGAIRGHERAVLVFGPGATAREVTVALETLAELAPRTHCLNIVLAEREQLADFQPLIDADRLFYLACGELPERELDALIDGARGARGREHSLDLFLAADDLRRLALAQSVTDLADALQTAAGNAVNARRSRCLLLDRERNALWTPSETGEEESAAVGLVSFILRSSSTVCLSRLAGDPRVDLDVDNPDGTLADRFLGVPVRAGRGAIVAVLVALRPGHEPPFEPLDITILEALAAHASPYLGSWLLDTPASPFRTNALRELDQPLAAGPEPLRLDARWSRNAPWLALATFAALLLALALKGWMLG